jgi:hypothetical protein
MLDDVVAQLMEMAAPGNPLTKMIAYCRLALLDLQTNGRMKAKNFHSIRVLFAAIAVALFAGPRTCPAGCLPRPSGLHQGWWPGDGSTIDLVSSNLGIINGGVSYTYGIVGQAFNFNGSDAFVELQNSRALTPLGSVSIEVWVNPATTNPGIIVSKWGDNNQRCYGLEIKPGAVYNFPITDAAHQNDAAFQYFPTGHAYFEGAIDELTVYNRALSADEIAAIYNAGSAGKCDGPFITSQPASQLVSYGLPVSFSVGASGAAY